MTTKKNPKGAGRKPISKKYSDALKRDVHSALAKKAKETGMTFGDVLVDVIYNDTPSNAPIRAGAFKIVQEILLIKETRTEQDVDIKTNIGPTIGLPPMMERPKEVKEEETVAMH